MQAFRIVFLLFLFLFTSNIIAQEKVEKSDNLENAQYLLNFDKKIFHWGFYFGFNYSDYKISYKAPEHYPEALVETDSNMGFIAGFISELRLHKNISLRVEPGFSLSSKQLYFKHLGEYPLLNERKASGAYIHIPLLVKFSTNRFKNIRYNAIGGISYDYNFASNFNNFDDNSSGEFRMQKNNYMYEVGLGMDFYFKRFKFSPSIRGIFAINNELKRDKNDNPPESISDWTTPIDYFGTQGVFLKLAFQ